MKSESEIYEKWKMHIYGIIIIAFIQCMGFPILYLFLKDFVVQDIIRNIIILIVLISYIAIDINYIYNKIYLVKKLLDQKPIRCILEDVVLIPYKEDKKTKYLPYPIIRSKYDNKLYMAYGSYCLTNFTHYIYTNGKNMCCTLYKSDRNPVNFGDDVDIYILKTINVPVSINRIKKKVKLKGKKFYFNHVNDNIDIDIFKEIKFFKGVVDLDAGKM